MNHPQTRYRARYRARPDLVIEVVEDECVVLDMEQNAYFGLNPVGRLVVEALQRDDHHLEELVEAVVERFEVASEQARGDVVAFLDELLAAGLAQRLAPGPGGGAAESDR